MIIYSQTLLEGVLRSLCYVILKALLVHRWSPRERQTLDTKINGQSRQGAHSTLIWGSTSWRYTTAIWHISIPDSGSPFQLYFTSFPLSWEKPSTEGALPGLACDHKHIAAYFFQLLHGWDSLSSPFFSHARLHSKVISVWDAPTPHSAQLKTTELWYDH